MSFKNHYSKLLYFIFFVFSCDDPNQPSDLWDPNDSGYPTPFISNVYPSDSAYSGSDRIKISGGNFKDNKDSIFVYFNTGLAEILSVDDSTILVIPPNVVSDSVKIKVAVQGAFLFGYYSKNYILFPRIIQYGNFDAIDESVWGLAVDAYENLYVGLSIFPEGKIDKLTAPFGSREEGFINSLLQTPYSMRIGPDNSIYYVDGVNPYIVKQSLITGVPSFNTLPGIVSDLDFDQNGNLYCGGSDQGLYIVDSELSSIIASDYTDVSIKAIRVFESHVYVAGNYSGEEDDVPSIGVWRNQILNTDGSLSEKEIVLNWVEVSNGSSNITAITFDENGTMYIASDANIALATYSTEGVFNELYSKIIFPPIAKMIWGNHNFLYLNYRGEPRAVYRIEMDINGAPYYGRQ
tara:strand:+ start:486 stop:1703 length:1218 start_codon:yes stop_codon:yes gene_type:complete